MKPFALALALALLAVPAAGHADVSLDDVTVRVISRVDGKIYELGKLPEDGEAAYPYGGDMDLLVGVQLSGTAAKAVDLTVEMRTPGFDSEATGKVPATKAKQKRKAFPPAEGKRWFFFVFEYECDNATFTAKIGKAAKKVAHNLSCAE